MNNKGFTITNLPHDERPRERLFTYGPEFLSSQELLALLLGRGIAGESVLVTAQRLLSHFGSLDAIVEASLEDLQKIRGLGVAKSSQIKACCEIARRIKLTKELSMIKNGKKNNIKQLWILIKSKIIDFNKENYVVLSFDVRNNFIGSDIVSLGTLNMSLIHPRETFNAAIKRHAAYIILCHNHPSGDVEPSNEDIQVTERLISAGKIVGIPIVDHLIMTSEKYYSMREQNDADFL